MLSLPNKDMADSVIYERGCALILRLKFKSSKESVTSRWSGRAKRDGFLDQVAGLFLVEFHRPGGTIK